MADLVTSVRVRPTGGPHAEVTVFVNHALLGPHHERAEEAEAFKALIQRAQRLEAAAIDLRRAAAAIHAKLDPDLSGTIGLGIFIREFDAVLAAEPAEEAAS